jgi:hypothetical protein
MLKSNLFVEYQSIFYKIPNKPSSLEEKEKSNNGKEINDQCESNRMILLTRSCLFVDLTWKPSNVIPNKPYGL